jgi:hypothetical protein
MSLFAVLCVYALSGCVLVPIPTAMADPEPFTPENLAAVQPGTTTRDEMRELFSRWRYTTDDGERTASIAPLGEPHARWWVFPLQRQMGNVAFAGLVAYFPGPLPVWTGHEDNYQYNWVVVEFDPADRVAAFWITRDGRACEPGEVCPGDDHLFVIASQAADLAAKSAAAPADACTVFIYADNGINDAVDVSMGQTRGVMFGQRTYLRWDVAPGAYTVQAVSENDSSTRIGAQPLTCTANETSYLALRGNRNTLAFDTPTAGDASKTLARRNGVVAVLPVPTDAQSRPTGDDIVINLDPGVSGATMESNNVYDGDQRQ